MFKAVVGQAEGTDTHQVSRAVIRQCQGQLNGLRPSAGLLFAADYFDHSVIIRQIRGAFPGIGLAGCTTAGEMSSSLGFSQDSVCLMLFASDTISMAAGIGLEVSKGPEQAFSRAVRKARAQLEGDPLLCLVFPVSLTEGLEAVLFSIQEMLGPECKIFGGLPGVDHIPAGRFFQFSSDKAHEDAVSILLLAGPLKIASVSCKSWKPVGVRAPVDRASGTKVHRIGGRTALQFYRESFGPYAVPLPEMPLAIFDDREGFYLRSAVTYNDIDESVEYPTPIREGQKVQLTEATPGSIISDMRACLDCLTKEIESTWTPQAGLLLSCVSRRWIMGSKTTEELAIADSVFPANLPMIGFYTFGEIAPLGENSIPALHNCTLVALLLGEEHQLVTHEKATRPERLFWEAATFDDPELLSRKLARARESQYRLELQRESFTHVLRRMNEDLTRANNKIEQQNQILKESLTLAQQVQQDLLPGEAPNLEGFDIAGRSMYCDETGGDYIDFIPGREGLAVVVGDVSGHGIAAALLMTTARALLRMRASMGGSPAELITDLNRALAFDVHNSGHFMTLMFLRINSKDNTLTWVRAGHEPGLRYCPDKDEFNQLRGEGVPLGILDNFQYDQSSASSLNPGEIIILDTDGIIETHNGRGEMFGRKRLMGIVRKNAARPAEAIMEACLAEVRDYRAGLPREDDETLVIIKAI